VKVMVQVRFCRLHCAHHVEISSARAHSVLLIPAPRVLQSKAARALSLHNSDRLQGGMKLIVKIRVLIALFPVALVACVDAGGRNAAMDAELSTIHDRIETLAGNEISCLTREAQARSLDRVDLETASLAVVARCAAPIQEFKVLYVPALSVESATVRGLVENSGRRITE
jgi:hypothetical protein